MLDQLPGLISQISGGACLILFAFRFYSATRDVVNIKQKEKRIKASALMDTSIDPMDFKRLAIIEDFHERTWKERHDNCKNAYRDSKAIYFLFLFSVCPVVVKFSKLSSRIIHTLPHSSSADNLRSTENQHTSHCCRSFHSKWQIFTGWSCYAHAQQVLHSDLSYCQTCQQS